MERRIIGIETEFGCLLRSERFGASQRANERVVEAVKDHAFLQKKLGLLDLHARDYAFEPARSGGFLLNGGRLYVDAVGSHEEYATPECTDWKDVVAYDRAGRVILQQLLDDLELSEDVAFYANSIDHFGGHTFGCHENYLVDISARNYTNSISLLLPFLVTRQIFAGVGRVGGHILNHKDLRRNIMDVGEYEVDTMWITDFYGVEIDETVEFQLSQRADHIVNTVSSRVRFNRAIINPKRDSYYDYSDSHRLHVLFGEANMSEYATWLKVATTSLTLDLVEQGVLPQELRLADPLAALKSVSRDSSYRWIVETITGKTVSAIDLQRSYLEIAQKYLQGRDAQTDEALVAWEEVLQSLETDPMSLADRLDWVAKKKLLEEFMASEEVGWSDEILHSLDMEYHNINPRMSLSAGLEEMGELKTVCTPEELERALKHPPTNTRAQGRGDIIRALIENGWERYIIDWDWVRLGEETYLELRDPFHDYRSEAQGLLDRLN